MKILLSITTSQSANARMICLHGRRPHDVHSVVHFITFITPQKHMIGAQEAICICSKAYAKTRCPRYEAKHVLSKNKVLG